MTGMQGLCATTFRRVATLRASVSSLVIITLLDTPQNANDRRHCGRIDVIRDISRFVLNALTIQALECELERGERGPPVTQRDGCLHR